jgi:penicillin-binding protein 1A
MSQAPRPSRVHLRLPKRWPILAVAVAVAFAAITGAALGYFLRLDLPDVQALEDYEPPQMTHVIAANGFLLDTFQEQRRIFVHYEEIPVEFRQALLAVEDAGFYEHTGLDFRSILRAAWRDLWSLSAAQGASTVTQQLARNLFLTPKKTIRRKVAEALLALEIERQYTKEEILGFYCNQIYMGHGRYGIEAASRYYYGVASRELTLNQAATLAGLIQRPEALSPLRHPDRSVRRRDYVLTRMESTGVLSSEDADIVRQEPLQVTEPAARTDIAPYFVEEIRRWLQGRFGTGNLYTAGFEVHSTLDPELQQIANRAVESGLRELDRRQGFRGATRRIPEDADPATWNEPTWSTEPEVGRIHDGVVTEVAEEGASVRVGPYSGTLGHDEISWTEAEQPGDILKVGDVIRVRLVSIDDASAARLTLEQEPVVEAAFVALDPATGYVKAMVGGFDFERSEFNRATQAKRQTGSAFKPIVFAAALSNGLTLADTLLDEPTVFLDPQRPAPYQPENYKNKYYGTITLRTALERSANIATVKLLDRIGYDAVIDAARRLGVRSELRPYASLALGAFETNLLELTAAYGTFANRGVWVEPHLVTEVLDRDGRPLERIEPDVRDALGPQVSFLMNRLLSGVITDGTGRAAASLNLPLAGKTGTTDDNTDAWFIGYAPGLAVGVWVGFDERRSLGQRETGARAALPIWRAFMKEAAEAAERLDAIEPPGVTLVTIDRRTGLRANPRAYCSPTITEAFLSGTEPTDLCSVYDHQRLRLPHPFQRYPIDEAGNLVIPVDELDRLMLQETNVRLAGGGTRIEAYLPGEVVSMGVKVVLNLLPPELDPDSYLPPFDTTAWIGKDGRPARIEWIGETARDTSRR